jgi:4'-phosphopantetheinyl transferase
VNSGAPGEGHVEVWVRHTESFDGSAMAATDVLLSADERERRDRLRSFEDRRDYAAAHILLRQTLSRVGPAAPAEWRFVLRAGGKPALDAAQAGSCALEFGLSHTRGLVACVVARGVVVGVDVERARPLTDARQIAVSRFAPEEVRLLDRCTASDMETRFLELWTLKEAYAKAIGLGLQVPLDSFAFAFERDDELEFAAPTGDEAPWQFWLAAVEPDARLALAVGGATLGRPVTVSFHNADPRSGPISILRTTRARAL